MTLSPKPKLIDPSWSLEKRIWAALEAISDRCDGARRLDGAGYSKYDRPIADRLQGLHLSQWSSKDVDEGLHLIRKYRKQLESMGVSIDDIIGDMGMVVMMDNSDNSSRPDYKVETIPADATPDQATAMVETFTVSADEMKKMRSNVALEDDSNSSNEVYCEFLTGSSGTGKTFEIRRRIADDPNYALLTATTGIAAINLGTITLNSALGYYNTESLEESMIKGYLEKKLRDIIEQGYKNICIDELSMQPRQQTDMIFEGIRRVNERSEWHNKAKLGMILTGDFCFGRGTQVMMADGSLKVVESISIGDQVMGPDSKPRNVIGTTTGFDEMYYVDQTNGDGYTVNSRHTLALIRGVDGSRLESGTWRRYPHMPNRINMSIKEFESRSRKFRECFVGYKAGLISFPSKAVTVDPYFLGIWLGDGSKDGPSITSEDEEVLQSCAAYATSRGLETSYHHYPGTHTKDINLISGHNRRPNPLLNDLRKYRVIDDKHIPEDYLFNSEEIRLQLLAGLLDSDGCWHGNRFTITLTIKQLIYQVKQLADQLGFRTSINPVKTGWYENPENGAAWTVNIGGDTWRIPTKIKRKQSKPRDLVRSRLTSVLEIIPCGFGKYFGFEIDGDHLFLLADGTVAHNCQLPPIPDKVIDKDSGIPWAFKANCFDKFEANTTRLTKFWRQSDVRFLEAINLIRHGNGRDAVRILKDIGIQFSMESDKGFDGTTILSKNDAVDGFNFVAHSRVNGQMIRVNNTRWGKLRKEWDNIPAELSLKIGSLVMVLVNDSPAFTYVNGDCGHVKDYQEYKGIADIDGNIPDGSYNMFTIELKRNNAKVEIGMITRFNYQKDAPRELGEDGHGLRKAYRYDPDSDSIPKSPAFDVKAHKWIVGAITYYPLRLAYASTVHKSQGLSLDNVQIDVNNRFFGAPAMAYVALSRARTPEGLRIVGTPDMLADRVKVHPEVLKWL